MSLVDYSRPSPQDGYYDVFLSFRGTDTRKGFTTSLYHALQQNAIHTFMDEDLMGEEIDYLFRVMAKSRMGVVIYSENFASSDWCLKELDTILQRQKEKKIAVTPIFYKVDLKELKHITGKTAEYLDEHIAEYGERTVELWKVAVKKLGGVSGISYKEIEWRSEYRFIEHVIAKIKKKLTEVRSSSPETPMKPSDIEKQRPNSSNQAAKNTCYVESTKGHNNFTLESLEPDVKIVSLAIKSPGRSDIVLSIPTDGKPEGLWFTLKEGSRYSLQFTFQVSNNIVSGLKYNNTVWKTGLKVDNTKEMLGTFSPLPEPYTHEMPEETTPSGMFARGSYTAKSTFLDDDNKCYLEINYTFDIRKEWKET